LFTLKSFYSNQYFFSCTKQWKMDKMFFETLFTPKQRQPKY